jgi:hypothetical protein
MNIFNLWIIRNMRCSWFWLSIITHHNLWWVWNDFLRNIFSHDLLLCIFSDQFFFPMIMSPKIVQRITNYLKRFAKRAEFLIFYIYIKCIFSNPISLNIKDNIQFKHGTYHLFPIVFLFYFFIIYTCNETQTPLCYMNCWFFLWNLHLDWINQMMWGNDMEFVVENFC